MKDRAKIADCVTVNGKQYGGEVWTTLPFDEPWLVVDVPVNRTRFRHMVPLYTGSPHRKKNLAHAKAMIQMCFDEVEQYGGFN